MKQFKVSYHLQIEFSEWINNHHFTLKCIPKTEPRQTITNLKTRCNAYDYSFGEDCFKNRTLFGYIEEEHKLLDLYMECKAKVDWEEYDTDTSILPVYKKQTPFTEPKGALLEYCQTMKEKCPVTRPLDIGVWLMHDIYQYMQYEKGSTTVDTKGYEAFEQGKGVCQDYVHIFLSVLRYFKIPCRYVAGAMVNENFSHAWIEIYSEGKWYGLDATNNLLVSDIYVVFSRGRDAKDCLINEGVFFGMKSKQKQIIELNVEEIE